jgi:replicative DNA helicase
MSALTDTSLAGQFDRLPPCSIDAERCALGSLMFAATRGDVKLVAEIRGSMHREDFYQADHQAIFDVLVARIDQGKPVDLVLLREDLKRLNLLDEMGGATYLAEIWKSMPSAAHGAHYAQVMREKAMLRQLIAMGNDMIRDGYAPSHSADKPVELFQKWMSRMSDVLNRNASTTYRTLDDVLIDVRAEMARGGVQTIPTGFRDLDHQIGGIGPGEQMVVAARPSMGKSTFGKQIALNAAHAGIPAAVVSLEEKDLKIGQNLLAGAAGIDNHQLRKPKRLTKENWQKIDAGINQLQGLPFFIADRARKVADIRSVLSVLKARHGVKLVVIDHLGRVGGVEGRTMYEKTTAVSLAISDMIKELNVAGIVLAQLNRGVESRDDKRPNMSDLRDSGAIEQDADVILFLHRDDYYYYADEGYEQNGEAELTIAKSRDGERGSVVTLRADLAHQRFENSDANVPMFD